LSMPTRSTLKDARSCVTPSTMNTDCNQTTGPPTPSTPPAPSNPMATRSAQLAAAPCAPECWTPLGARQIPTHRCTPGSWQPVAPCYSLVYATECCEPHLKTMAYNLLRSDCVR
jgi:hypothetical protein